jgi:hypothetical protein
MSTIMPSRDRRSAHAGGAVDELSDNYYHIWHSIDESELGNGDIPHYR